MRLHFKKISFEAALKGSEAKKVIPMQAFLPLKPTIRVEDRPIKDRGQKPKIVQLNHLVIFNEKGITLKLAALAETRSKFKFKVECLLFNHTHHNRVKKEEKIGFSKKE